MQEGNRPKRSQPHTTEASALVLRRARYVVLPAIVIAGLVLVVGLTFVLRSPAGSRPPSADLEPLLEETGPLIVYSEFGEGADTLWAADPDDPQNRVQLATIDHAPGFGIAPSLSPDGSFIAYASMSPGTRVLTNADLWLLDIESGDTKLLSEGVDLRVTPVWSPEADALVVRRSASLEGAAGSSELLRVDLGGVTTALATGTEGLSPIDFTPDGTSLYYAAPTGGGSDLLRVPALGGASERLARLSEGVSRDWHLSPDGTQLAYLAQAPADASATFVAQVLELASGEAQRAISQPVDQFGPAWEPDGSLTVGRIDSDNGAPTRLAADGSALPELPGAGAGFDVPLSWSPDGEQLAARAFEGMSAANPGPSRVVVLSIDGERRELSRISDIAIAGWLEETG